MPDEPVVAAEPVIEPVATPVVEPVTNFFGTDGVLNEGWRGTLDEDLREEKSLVGFKTVNDLSKSFVMTKKMVGSDTITIPTDASTEGEWQEYHKAGGRPETVADYNLGVPEGFPEEIKEKVFPNGRIEKWQERFFKGGVSKKAADAFIAEFAQDVLADYQNIKLTQEQEMASLKSGLSTDWGAAYEQNKHFGDIAITEGSKGDFEFQQRLESKFGRDPDFIRFASNLGSKFSEGKPPGDYQIPTPSDYQEQIDAYMADPLYTNGTEKQRMNIAEKIMAIRKLQKPEPVRT